MCRRVARCGLQTRTAVGSHILDNKAKTQQTLCWHQEERPLTKLVDNSPDLHPGSQGIAGTMHNKIGVQSKIKFLLTKHGSPPIAWKVLFADLASLAQKS